MYETRILDGSHSEWVYIEAGAWLKVFEELSANLSDIGSERRNDARRLIDEATTALRLCTSKAMGFDDPLVASARKAVKAALSPAPDMVALVDAVFFLALSTYSLESLVDRAENIDLTQLPSRQRQELRKALESALNTFETQIVEMEKELNGSDAGECDEARDG